MKPIKKIFFNAGPAKVTEEVMKQARDEFLDYQGVGIGVVELSHRSKEFEAISAELEVNLRKLLKIPDNYAVLFMQGGGKTQFDSVPLNMCTELNKCQVDYIVTGSWSKMAADEAEKYCKVKRQVFDHVPTKEELELPQCACYRFYCDNETIHGREFHYVPEADGVPLVCDMTSNFMSKPVDVSKFAVIFASAQKNLGIAGLTVVIVREDFLGKQMSITPKIQNYKVMRDNKSLYNTPPTFSIYMAGLSCKWLLKQGGLEIMERRSKEKASILYSVIDDSAGFYVNPVAPLNRSCMNVIFILSDKSLDPKFLKESEEAGLFGLKGHRSVGGFRASIYHGVTVEDVQRLAQFLKDFSTRHNPQ